MHDRCHDRRASGDELACTGGWPVVGPVFQLNGIWPIKGSESLIVQELRPLMKRALACQTPQYIFTAGAARRDLTGQLVARR